MRLKCWTILLLSFAALHARADGNVMFEQANALYHSKNYDSAAKLYTQLIQNGFGSDDLYYNMGNAFYRSGKIGWAIWSYKKSIAHQCTQNALDNYRLAKRQIKNPLLEQDEIFFISWWRSFYSLFSVNAWAILAFVFFSICLFTLYWRLIRKKRLPAWVTYLFFAQFLLCIFLMFIQYHNSIQHYKAVVVESTFFESAHSSETERIPEGSEIRMLDNEPDSNSTKVFVQLSDLREGYIAKKTLKRL